MGSCGNLFDKTNSIKFPMVRFIHLNQFLILSLVVLTSLPGCNAYYGVAPTGSKSAKGVKGAKNDKSSKADVSKSSKSTESKTPKGEGKGKGGSGLKFDKAGNMIKTPKSSKSA